MPTLLVDLDTIDLDAITVTAEEVAGINPQCGAMRQLDHVIWLSENSQCAVGVKSVTDDEFWVPLHVPGRPLMPGVLMIEAAAQLSSVQYRFREGIVKFLGFTRCDDTIFRGQVVPGDKLYLVSEAIATNRRRFINCCQGIVNGKLVFETKITGMVL